jgi:hypothetical protein
LFAGWTEAGFKPASPTGLYQARCQHWHTWDYLDAFLLGEVASGVIGAEMSGKDEGWFSHPAWQARSVDYSPSARPALRWSAMVLHVPGHESAGVGALEAERGYAIL